MVMTIHQAHDKLFKYSLSKKTIAISFLKSRLSSEIYKLINIETLQLTDKSFVLPEFREIHSDIVYQCQINEKKGYIFFILEHESTAHVELMAFRQLQYTISAMDQYCRQGNKKLPIVLPICVYHGIKSPYPHSQDVYDNFENSQIARQIVFKPFTLIDLTV
ncbi:Rpn family recombination-promoting nuclease/putative transposase, partial [Rickettsiella grylli]|uniref:Rpn family recombination-promoting nuclease/putative transposase n=1 Tax=Rickettsiella grylli TaxID=59196 RepID=UPI000B105946